MRDIIWTVIVLWLVWKVLDAFKLITKSQQKQSAGYQNYNQNQQGYTNQKKDGEVKVESFANKQKPHFKPTDGEYVDYEEVK